MPGTARTGSGSASSRAAQGRALLAPLGLRPGARTRPVADGRKTNLLRVMVKPLAGGGLDEYFALVARDRPDTA